MLTLKEFQSARDLIAPHVRRTPVIDVRPTRAPAGSTAQYQLKLESMQVTGAFKVRGATCHALRLTNEQRKLGLITASGGNHGLGVACAARLVGSHALVYLPANAPEHKAEALRGWGAEVRWEGAVWDEANEAALAEAERAGRAYLHPFADRDVIAGQGTIALELLEDAPDTEVLVVPIGGGGLIAGMANAARRLNPRIHIVGVEPVGAPTLLRSLEAGEPTLLESVDTEANTLAPRGTHRMNFDIIRECVNEIVLVTDDEMRAARSWLWEELYIGAELSGAAATAAVLNDRSASFSGARVSGIVCGGGLP
jgi:threonine dehydratase